MRYHRREYLEPVETEKAEIARLQREAEERFDESYRKSAIGRGRMSKKAKLEKLGITAEEAAWAFDFFGPRWSLVNILRYDDGGQDKTDPAGWKRWVNEKAEKPILLTDVNVLLDHFLHRRRLVATERYFSLFNDQEVSGYEGQLQSGVEYTSQLIIDLDAHLEKVDDLWDRYWAIRESAEVTPIVIQSSDSGGLHLYWGLPRLMDVEEAQNHAAIGVIRKGIPIKAGICEVFPDYEAPIRVPFGPGSYLRDPDTLEVVKGSFAEIFRLFRSRILEQKQGGIMPFGETGSIDDEGLMDGTQLYDALWDFDPCEGIEDVHDADDVTPATEQSHDAPRPEEWDLGRRLWEDGLTGEIDRYDAIPVVVRHCYFERGVTKGEELVHEVYEWLKQKHNYKSDRFPRSPRAVFKDILKVVQDHLRYARQRNLQPHGGARLVHCLTKDDCIRILELAVKLVPDFGKKATPHKILHGLFPLFLYARNRTKTDLINPVFRLPKDTMVKSFPSWTTKPRSPFYYRKWLDVLQAKGILVVEDSAYSPGRGKQRGRSRRYRLVHTFNPGIPVPTSDDGFRIAADNSDLLPDS